MIEVHHIAKSFGPVKAVHDVSFAAPDGLITGLLGPNGAGKTTTMRMITGIIKPDHGTTMIDGYDTKTQSLEIQRRLGALPDNRGLYPRLTARENIRYYGQLHDMDGKTLEANINTLIDLLDMHDIADRRTEGFSSGERVKVAIARPLVHQPQNIILDEPTTGLDIMSTRAMRQFIRRLRDEGRCVLFTSHIMQEVAALCQNIVIVAHGRVSAQGSPDELRQATGQESLEDAFVDLIGSGEGLE